MVKARVLSASMAGAYRRDQDRRVLSGATACACGTVSWAEAASTASRVARGPRTASTVSRAPTDRNLGHDAIDAYRRAARRRGASRAGRNRRHHTAREDDRVVRQGWIVITNERRVLQASSNP